VVRHSDAAKRIVAGCTPDGPLNVVSTTPARTSGPCSPPQRLCDALASETGETGGLAQLEDAEQRREVRAALLAYCRLDTLAMVKIWQALEQLASPTH
jgi:hypothetical protein